MSESVLIGGVFDPLHAGHLAYIREALSWGVPVDCALSDARQKHPPLVPIKQRAELLRALGVRDVYRHMTPGDLPDMILALKPKAYIKGKDWEGNLPDEQVKACHDVGATVVFTNTKQQSSSKMLADYERTRNAQKLEAFEDWVLSQKPAERLWEPVTDYSRETRRSIEAPQADIIAEAFSGYDVLDYGCGFGYLVELLEERGMVADGWDPERVGFGRAADSPFLSDPPLNRTPSGLVICREVLEHLHVSDVVRTVRNLVKLSNRFVYVTTRFTDNSHLLDFDTSDSLDPTHITMLNQDLLRTLFVLEGCKRRADLEATLDHRNLGRCLVYEVARD